MTGARGASGILGRTARRGLALLAVVAALVLAPSPGAAPSAKFDLPPQEALDESLAYCHWQHVSTEILRDGETAEVRLRHPKNPRIIARLTYRLVASSVVEAEE